MAVNVQIKCINKSDRPNPHERIVNIGGSPGATTTRWKRSQQQAITEIEAGTYNYYVAVPNAEAVWVIVATSQWGHKYIKTTADGEHPNNLLALAECPP